MKRSGPQFAMLKPDPKTGEIKPALPPRVKKPNPIPQNSGIIDKIKRSSCAEKAHLLNEGLSYDNISPRTKRRLKSLAAS